MQVTIKDRNGEIVTRTVPATYRTVIWSADGDIYASQQPLVSHPDGDITPEQVNDFDLCSFIAGASIGVVAVVSIVLILRGILFQFTA